jgi:hypothetical protein
LETTEYLLRNGCKQENSTLGKIYLEMKPKELSIVRDICKNKKLSVSDTNDLIKHLIPDLKVRLGVMKAFGRELRKNDHTKKIYLVYKDLFKTK